MESRDTATEGSYKETLAKGRANWLGVPAFFHLNNACKLLWQAFGGGVYLVGSVLERPNYRDVDIRAIMQDEDFERMFPELKGSSNLQVSALGSLLCAVISDYLAKLSGLPIDFQIQKQSAANKQYPDQPRCAIGMFVARD